MPAPYFKYTWVNCRSNINRRVQGFAARTGYSSSKFAIYGFLDTLRVEHLKDDLHVMIFAPGFTASNIREEALVSDGSRQGETPRDEASMMSAESVQYI